MSQKRLMTSFKLTFEKMLRFWGNFEKSQNWETPSYLSNFKFSNKVLFKVKLIQNKNLFVEGAYHEKTDRGGGGGVKKLKSYLLSNGERHPSQTSLVQKG